jgi:hypothetical protein
VAASSERTRSIDGLQGAVAFVGITLGAIPIVRWAIQEEHGALFEWLFGVQMGSMGYVAPLAVMVVAIGIIAALEMTKRRT